MKNKRIVWSLLLLAHYALVEAKGNPNRNRETIIREIERSFKGMSQKEAKKAFEQDTFNNPLLQNESYNGPIEEFIKTLPVTVEKSEKTDTQETKTTNLPPQDTVPTKTTKQDVKPTEKTKEKLPPQDTQPTKTTKDNLPPQDTQPQDKLPKQDTKPTQNETKITTPAWASLLKIPVIANIKAHKESLKNKDAKETGIKTIDLKGAYRGNIQTKMRTLGGYQLPVKNRFADGTEKEAFNGAFRSALLFNEYFTSQGYNWKQNNKDADYTLPFEFFKEIKFNTANKVTAIEKKDFDTLAYKNSLQVIVVEDDATLRRTNHKTKTSYVANETSEKELKANQKRRHELFDDIAAKMIQAYENNKAHIEYFVVEDVKGHHITFVATYGLLEETKQKASFFVMDDNNDLQLNNPELLYLMVEVEEALDRKLHPTKNEKEAKFTEHAFNIVQNNKETKSVLLNSCEKTHAEVRTVQFRSIISKDIENNNGIITIQHECRLEAFRNYFRIYRFFSDRVYENKKYNATKDRFKKDPFKLEDGNSIGLDVSHVNQKTDSTFNTLTKIHNDSIYVVNEYNKEIIKIKYGSESTFTKEKELENNKNNKKEYKELFNEIGKQLFNDFKGNTSKFSLTKREYGFQSYVPFMICVENGTKKQHYITLVITHLPELLSSQPLTAFVLDSYDNSDYTNHPAVTFIIKEVQEALSKEIEAEEAKKNPVVVEPNDNREDGWNTISLGVKKSGAASTVDKKNGDPVKLAGLSKKISHDIELIQVPAKLVTTDNLALNTNAAFRDARMVDLYFANKMYNNPQTNKNLDYRAPFVDYTKMNFDGLGGISETTARPFDKLTSSNNFPVYIVDDYNRMIQSSEGVSYYKESPLPKDGKSYNDLFENLAKKFYDKTQEHKGKNKTILTQSFMININGDKEEPVYGTFTLVLLPEVETLYGFILNSTDKEMSLLTNPTIVKIADEIGSRYRNLQKEEKNKRPKTDAEELAKSKK